MSDRHNNWARWSAVVVFAIAMAWVEAAVVFDLRTLVNRIEPYQPNPLPLVGGLGPVELVREVATLVMLAAVGFLAGRTWPHRLAYATLAFGIWDIFYYAFLRVICGWPHSLLDWDILFLLPLPWWGPVLAPLSIALLMVLWGTLVSQDSARPTRRTAPWAAWLFAGAGALVALYAFMADALRVASQGAETVRKVLPTHFSWPWFAVALALMATPLLQHLVDRRSSRPPRPAQPAPARIEPPVFEPLPTLPPADRLEQPCSARVKSKV